MSDEAPARIEARAEIARLRAAGYEWAAIARKLNRRGFATPSGRGRWHPDTVKAPHRPGVPIQERRVHAPLPGPALDHTVTRNVVALRPDAVTPPSPRSSMHEALDDLEAAADEAGVLYVDVVLQLALARHLVDVVGSIHLGDEPTVAQVHAIRELRLVTTELRQLILEHSRRR